MEAQLGINNAQDKQAETRPLDMHLPIRRKKCEDTLLAGLDIDFRKDLGQY